MAISGNNDSRNFFTQLVVRYADNGTILHRISFKENRLHFNAVDILSASQHHVLDAIHHIDEAIRVNESGITRMEPTIRERFCSLLWLVPITTHIVRAVHPNFTNGPWRNILAIFPNNTDIGSDIRKTHTVLLGEVRSATVADNRCCGFCESVSVCSTDLASEILFNPCDRVRRNRCASL